uniref:Uncharacterized protein n=1 Tax=Oryza rufipogon TaxID=4529 RepID=A0A0E0QZC3_ORYRU
MPLQSTAGPATPSSLLLPPPLSRVNARRSPSLDQRRRYRASTAGPPQSLHASSRVPRLLDSTREMLQSTAATDGAGRGQSRCCPQSLPKLRIHGRMALPANIVDKDRSIYLLTVEGYIVGLGLTACSLFTIQL